jgi:excisionase family DNA binding protein
MRCPPGTISLLDAGARLQLNYRTIKRLIARGELRGHREGRERHWVVNEADVNRYLAARVARSLAALAGPTPSEKEPAP